ncbi:MAG: hypothetical protein LC799_04500, partial [Actinobacteria bacterium]|nr:hypothetical protein [Actinomycetota bacterium]
LFLVARAAGWVTSSRRTRRSDREFVERLRASGVANFYASRSDYVRFRGAPRLTDYLATANKTIIVAAYWMGHGNEAEGIANVLGKLVDTRPELSATVAVIDPTSPHMPQLADYLAVPPAEVEARLASTLRNLARARDGMSTDGRRRLDIRVYRDLPMASIIMLDDGDDNGRIQLDIKPFRAPRESSFGVELVARPDGLYQVCRRSCHDLISRSSSFDPTIHLLASS